MLVCGGVIYTYKNSEKNEHANNNNDVIESSPTTGNNVVNIYTDKAEENNAQQPNEDKQETAGNPKIEKDEEITKPDKEFTFVALGEIMMGQFATQEDFSYAIPFVNVSEYAKDADYTFASLATNIIDLDVIENATSKYIVTKDITRAFTALGVDGINIATDHIMDFSTKVFTETKNILNNSDIDIMGLQDDIIYAKKDGIKVAFIAVCNEVIGSYSKYINAGISMYDDYMVKIKANISKAKQNADTVVLITHLGSENSHEVMSVMSWFYKELIKAGADMVLGNHALGVYPIEIYNGKPIIYSLGYLMGDTDYEIGKKSGIFKFTVDVEGNINKLEITPTYIDGDDVLIYTEYNLEDAIEFMKYISTNSEKQGFSANIENNKKLVIEF